MNRLKILFVMFLLMSGSCFAFVRDEFADEIFKDTEPVKPVTNLNYNYESCEKIPIKLKIKQNISTKKDGVYDGQEVLFEVRQNVKYNNKIILKQGDLVKATVDGYLSRGMNGIPASIILDNFEMSGIDSKKIKGFYKKRGLNLSLMVYPIKWALTPIPGVGSLTNFILGGNAHITSRDTVVIYYYPNWGKTKESSPID